MDIVSYPVLKDTIEALEFRRVALIKREGSIDWFATFVAKDVERFPN